eukprot:CAMPEP_0115627304 /NCGR_PEP_ID=MMETSP0272-20121206/28802_1 /TAXON_ID=71861 /ORGANISM="Scrippsiella trochoidea, Strain CCMP3099" /LENGTH=163 /DNA_ID=CAMNT_0003063709 /DNA_START=30 /DNA_END=521 /DNA_ORIENTATION=+
MTGAMFVEAPPVLPYAAAHAILQAVSSEEARTEEMSGFFSLDMSEEQEEEEEEEVRCVPSQEAFAQRRSRRLACLSSGQLPCAAAAAAAIAEPAPAQDSSASEGDGLGLDIVDDGGSAHEDEARAESKRRARRLKHVGSEDLSVTAAQLAPLHATTGTCCSSS